MRPFFIWATISAFILMVLLSAVGCATPHPAMLCRIQMTPTGEPVLFCAPLPAGTMPRDAT